MHTLSVIRWIVPAGSALQPLGAALAAELVWIAVILARGGASLAYLARPFLFTASLGALFVVRGRAPWAVVLARLTIGGAFLNALWSRFDDFGRFIAYTARVNAFLPASTAPFLAVAATVLEVVFCAALLLGVETRRAAAGSAILLGLFATAMVASGLSQFEWAVYVLAAGAWVIAGSDAGNRFARRLA